MVCVVSLWYPLSFILTCACVVGRHGNAYSHMQAWGWEDTIKHLAAGKQIMLNVE